MPKFASELDWQRAQHLMQPALIRIIDNIRKQLDVSDWQGSYHTDQIWPEDIPETQRDEFNALQQQLNAAKNVEESDAIEQQLAQLPTPLYVYALQLKRGEQQHSVDLWQLCYQLCFRNYPSNPAESPVEIDTSLLDDDTGEVDWDILDEKAKQLIQRVFVGLPDD
ncbi:MAG: hypothetical protein AAF215_16750 [Cyanobacteria bacterium P01_A01_bin.123]